MPVKVYDGTNWVTVAGDGQQGAASSSSIVTWVKTASGGETSLSGNDDNSQSLSYTAGQELVYINGVLQKRNVDYVATTGTTITGLNALAASDVVTVWTVNAFSVTNAIPNSTITAKGDLIVGTGSGTYVTQTVGTDGQVLTADSTQADGIKWATAAAGGWTQIGSAVTLSGTSTTISSIPTTYRQYMLIGASVSNGGNTVNDTWYVQPNGQVSWFYEQIYTGNTGAMQSGGGSSGRTNFPQACYQLSTLKWVATRNPAQSNGNYIEGSATSTATAAVNLVQKVTGYLVGSTSPFTSLTIGTSAGTSTISGTVYLYGLA